MLITIEYFSSRHITVISFLWVYSKCMEGGGGNYLQKKKSGKELRIWYPCSEKHYEVTVTHAE